MVFAAFASYYYSPQRVYFRAWDPDLEHRDIEDALPEEIVDINKAAEQFAPTPELQRQLDDLITKNIYHCLVADKLDYLFLESQGFVIMKDSSHRVVFHRKHPDLIIKIGIKPLRALPMEGNIKREREPKESVWIPLKNTNLLRAAGREYFISHLSEDLKEAFYFPEEFLYQISHAQPDDPDHLRFFSVAKRGEAFNGESTLNLIRSWPSDAQREVASLIIKWIECSRFHDWSAYNLLLGKGNLERKFVVVDCEPLGILIDQGDKNCSLLNEKEHILLSLINFRDNYCRQNELWEMAEVVEGAIDDYLKANPEVKSRTGDCGFYGDPLPLSNGEKCVLVALIIASIVIPLIPLLFLIHACLSVCLDVLSSRRGNPASDLSLLKV